MEKYSALLSSAPLFSGIDPGDLQAMLQCLSARVLTAAKDDPVFLEGDPAGFVGLVLEGIVQVVRDDFYGNRSVLTHAQPGDIFAEAYACAGVETMPVSGYALSDCTWMRLDCRKMLTICSNSCTFHNRLVKNLLGLTAQKNLQLSAKIQFMSQKTTQAKLMAYLSQQAKIQGSAAFTIPFQRQALADYLGVDRSAMSAEISKLRQNGVLECKGNWFHLL